MPPKKRRRSSNHHQETNNDETNDTSTSTSTSLANTDHPLQTSLKIVDPILQLLTKRTGEAFISASMLLSLLPSALNNKLDNSNNIDNNDTNETNDSTNNNIDMKDCIKELVRIQVLVLSKSQTHLEPCEDFADNVFVGFGDCGGKLKSVQSKNRAGLVLYNVSGSTNKAAKVRQTYLSVLLKNTTVNINENRAEEKDPIVKKSQDAASSSSNISLPRTQNEIDKISNSSLLNKCNGQKSPNSEEIKILHEFLGTDEGQTDYGPRYAGKKLAQKAEYAFLDVLKESNSNLYAACQTTGNLFGYNLFRESRYNSSKQKQLFSHQAKAINSIINREHTVICTSTGSGKSLCFLIPIIARIIASSNEKALLLYPTKALAQDQLRKILDLLETDSSDLRNVVKPGIIDGDVPYQYRQAVAENCNIILTNPDTIHASILSAIAKNKNSFYRPFLASVTYMVFDEAHIYEGSFGAHVSLVLSRFSRVRTICSESLTQEDDKLTFVACSATLANPESRFRQLFCVPASVRIIVVGEDDDRSPKPAKLFYLWNPPQFNRNEFSLGSVESYLIQTSTECESESLKKASKYAIRRKHPADETAHLVVCALRKGIRFIAFAKTRGLVEWIFEKAMATLKSNKETSHLVTKVESYRGGYSVDTRRDIEQKLFRGELLGVVGTCALELGVDIGGIDVTFHCGYPGTQSALYQQAGRAGRGGYSDTPSFCVMVCFNSPADQYLWRNSSIILKKSTVDASSFPLDSSIIQRHMLCAAAESPLTGPFPAKSYYVRLTNSCNFPSDHELFFSQQLFDDGINSLLEKGFIRQVGVRYESSQVEEYVAFRVHESHSHPWQSVSIRSIEPISYSIVDLTHPDQRIKTKSIAQNAVLDTIPYSRVFYHAHPGAIILHRGERYEIISLDTPPAVLDLWHSSVDNLGAYVRPTNAKYTTRPLSTLIISVVRQFETIEKKETIGDKTNNALAGSGVVTVKRRIHGYKKLSPVTREEMSRHEVQLPPMEFDTNAIWLEVDPELRNDIKYFNEGIHALAHALISVAPLFISCSTSDLNTDHSIYDCTRVVLFDSKAGGNGTSNLLFPKLKLLLGAALNILQNCEDCETERHYDGGCPCCIHHYSCLNWNDGLSKTAGSKIANYLIKSLVESSTPLLDIDNKTTHSDQNVTPRKRAREKSKREARNLSGAVKRSIVIGRPSWPTDNAKEQH